MLAALAPCARLLLLLALAPVEPLRHHRAARAQLGKLGFQRFNPAPRSLRGPVQTGVLPGQRFDRRLLATRAAQASAQLHVHARERRRQCPPGRAKPGNAGLRRLPAGSRRLHRLAQTGVLLAQPLDHGLLTPRPLEHGAQLSSLVEGQLRQRRPGHAQLGNPGLQLLFPAPGQFERVAQPVHLVGQRLGPGLDILQVPQLPMEPQVLAGQLLGALPDGLRPLLLAVHLLVQLADRFAPPGHLLAQPPVLRAQGLDRDLQLPRLGRGRLRPASSAGMRPGGVFRGLPIRQNLAQPGDLVAQSYDPDVFARAGGLPDELPQVRHFRLQGRHLLDRAVELLRLLLGLA